MALRSQLTVKAADEGASFLSYCVTATSESDFLIPYNKSRLVETVCLKVGGVRPEGFLQNRFVAAA